MNRNALDQTARSILQKNDRGGYTVPTDRLYPYQWNWDSAFVSLGFAGDDRARAWQELFLLVEGQWDDGMIPHIIFRQDDPDYFPGPSVWNTPAGKYPTGGISQPPVLTSVVTDLVDSGDETDLAYAKKLFDQLYRWHTWWHHARTPEGSSLIATVHPWETGRDNCPDWDLGLDRMTASTDLPPYTRRDTSHVDPSMRPSDAQYDKYLTIVMAGRAVDWDQKRLTNEGPFAMYCPGLIFILHRADKDLKRLAHRIGKTAEADQLAAWIAATEADLDRIWNPDFKAFCARDVRSGAFADGFSNASPLCFYAHAGTQDQLLATLDHVHRISHKVGHLMPSWDPDHPAFESKRYWCGPLWPQMNFLLWKGLVEHHQTYLAHRTQNDLARAIEASGFWECFDPTDGSGCVGTDFSWTAALWLAWLSPSRKKAAA
ncbi:MAG: hypothetical protein OXC60_20140 [Litoreibacter sp.]|nr:hypothetical protein [Litoreibacter sp.]